MSWPNYNELKPRKILLFFSCDPQPLVPYNPLMRITSIQDAVAAIILTIIVTIIAATLNSC